jgi:hypothetical protein
MWSSGSTLELWHGDIGINEYGIMRMYELCQAIAEQNIAWLKKIPKLGRSPKAESKQYDVRFYKPLV